VTHLEATYRTALPGYRFIEELHRGPRRIVYRAERSSDHVPVVVKTVAGELVAERDVAALSREFDLLRGLDVPGVVTALAFHKHPQPALVLEDIGGRALRTLLARNAVTLKSFLTPACRLCEALGGLHRRGITHRDVTPNNIVLAPDTGDIRLIDFGLAARSTPEQQPARHPNLLEGTLAYMAPEQTGRMNRVPDHRADLYSLGVVLYEIATGRLPFPSSDVLEIVHAHMAVVPVAPHLVAPNVPPVVSAMIMRLLAKDAEDRYQSAFGLLGDLERCAASLRSSDTVAAFRIGEQDVSEHFQVSQKLYGRDAEVTTLMEAFQRVGAGTTEALIVSGYSGIGKSALINEVHKPITARRGYFIAGKFDQFGRNIPYSALIEAFQGLVTDERRRSLPSGISAGWHSRS
jgi:serine/threonine protein kinase